MLNEGVSKPNVAKVDIKKYFITKQMLAFRDHMLQWIFVKVFKLGFRIIIERNKSIFYNKQVYVNRGGDYKKTNRKLKYEDIISKKCGCSL